MSPNSWTLCSRGRPQLKHFAAGKLLELSTSEIQRIPLSKLSVSLANVRRNDRQAHIDMLAASVAAQWTGRKRAPAARQSESGALAS